MSHLRPCCVWYHPAPSVSMTGEKRRCPGVGRNPTPEPAYGSGRGVGPMPYATVVATAAGQLVGRGETCGWVSLTRLVAGRRARGDSWHSVPKAVRTMSQGVVAKQPDWPNQPRYATSSR